MRILYIGAASSVAGAERSLLTSIVNLPNDLAAEVKVLVPGEGEFTELLKKHGIPYDTYQLRKMLPAFRRIGGIKIFDLLSILQNLKQIAGMVGSVSRHVKSFDPDIVHMNNFELNLYLPFFLKRSTRARVICHVRELQIKKRRIFPALQFVFRRYVDKILVVSQAVKDIFYPALSPKVNVLYNAVDLKLYDVASTRESIRTQIGATNDDFMVLAAGRITPWKGYDVLLKALSKLNNGNIHVCIAGDASLGSKRYFDQLKNLVKDLNLESQVCFFGYTSEMGSLINACDIAVHSPIEDEPLGRFILEAMGFGKAMITARGGGACEIIEDGVSGLFFQPGNVDELASKMQILFEDKELRESLGEHARDTIAGKFSPGAHALALSKIYRELSS